MRASPHDYGPHDKTTQPTTVTVFRREEDGGDVDVPIPLEVRRQRWQLSSIAHARALERQADAEVSSWL